MQAPVQLLLASALALGQVTTSTAALSPSLAISADNVIINFDLQDSTLSQYQVFPIPYPSDPRPVTEESTHLIFLDDGRIATYNGTFSPYLSVLDTQTGGWTHFTAPGLSRAGDIAAGHLASYQNYVFVQDMDSGGTEQAQGIVRFNIQTGEHARFATEYTYYGPSDVAVVNGSVHVLDNDAFTRTGTHIDIDNLTHSKVHVYDPVSLAYVKTVVLDGRVSEFAIDSQGEIFGIDGPYGNLIKYSAEGQELARINVCDAIPRVLCSPVDFSISRDNTLLIGTRFGQLIFADPMLLDVGVVDFEMNTTSIYAALTTSPVPEPATSYFYLVGAIAVMLVRRVRPS